jgi:membrane-associated phospholipid phosphatase
LGIVGVGSLAVIIVLALALWHVKGATGLDKTVGGLTPSRANHALLVRVTWPGSSVLVFVATAVLLVAARIRRDWFGVALCAIGPVMAGFVSEVVAKPLVDRVKGTSLSFPSGHTTLAAAVGALVVLIVYRSWGSKAAAIVAVPASTIILIVGVAVVRLGWHYPTDAAGGIPLGVGVVFSAAAALSTLWPRIMSEGEFGAEKSA